MDPTSDIEWMRTKEERMTMTIMTNDDDDEMTIPVRTSYLSRTTNFPNMKTS